MNFQKYRWIFFVITFLLITIVAAALKKPDQTVPPISNAIFLVGAVCVGLYLLYKLVTALFKSFRKVDGSKAEKKNGLTFIILIVALIIASSIGGVIGKEAGSEIFSNLFQGRDIKPEIISKTGFTQVHKDAHIQGCIQSGGSDSYCECTFEHIKDKITPGDLKVLLENYQLSNELPDIVVKSRNVCISEPNSLQKETSQTSVSPNSNKNTVLEIEKCRIDSKNIDLEKVGKSFENTVNQMVKDGIQLSNDQIKKMYDDYIQNAKDSKYKNCLDEL